MATDRLSPRQGDGPAAIQAASELLKAGRPREAASLYVSVLSDAPNQFAALCGLGVCSAQMGAAAEADALFSQASKAAADSPESHANLGLLLAKFNRIEMAVESFARALGLNPDNAAAHFHLANALCRLGRFEAAVERFQSAIALAPRWPEAHNNLGVALQGLSRFVEALSAHQAAAELNPGLVDAQANLGKAHRNLGHLGPAAGYYAKALALKPDDAELHNTLAGLLHGLGRFSEGLASGRRALALSPDYAEAHFNVGLLLQATGEASAAIQHYQRALALRPDFAEAQNNLGNALQKLGRFKEAVAPYEKAAELRPDFAETHHNLAKALQALGRPQEALGQFETALALEPAQAPLHNDYAGALIALGRVSDAQRAFARAASLAPDDLAIQLNLANYQRFSPGDSRLPALERLAGLEAALSETDQIALNFALGKACADLQQTERSFECLLKANRLKRCLTAYDEQATLGYFERIREVFTPELASALRGSGPSSAAPVFVLGMPRSGTTLIEQILASHSRVFGGGELDVFARGVTEFLPAFPQTAPVPPKEKLRQLGAHYLDSIGELSAGAERIVDKMPSNFIFAGLIHLALPNARIIHARRDPIDTCLSCFSLLFTEDQPFTYDLGELGRYYRAYASLMDHWRRVLPPGVMIDVHYEDVVADLEGQSRRMLAHCGLDWEDSCLAFHQTQRPVHTASVAQVRRPLYADSIGRWRPYEKQLQPLIRELA